MNYKAEVEQLIANLHNVAEKRREFSGHLAQTAQTLIQSELEGEQTSGKLNLNAEIQDLKTTAEHLAAGRFRLMVLGDMKHGKSTLLNVLLGKDLLPRAVNPCTAILTVIRFGTEEKVTVHFKQGETETLSFEAFGSKYTIDPNEAKRLESTGESAFPDVDYAVVEYPLELLQNGVEIVDSPGLNDTDERNQLTLNYVSNCHAIFFILNATKPCTMEERRYLENYLKGRGLTIFFLINRWDELQKSAFDPDDAIEVQKVEQEQRQVFQANLRDYCQVEGSDLYAERVFETSGLNALRARLKNQSMDGTGLPEFIGALEQFLTKERAIAEFRQVRTLMRQTHVCIREKVNSRLPILEQDVTELRERVKSVEPEFRKLADIRDSFQREIIRVRDEQSEAIAQSVYNFLSHLDDTFETDFKPYMPDLNFFKFLSGGQREQFKQKMEAGFKKYINDKMAQWSRDAERDIQLAFSQLQVSASEYGSAYGSVTDTISTKLAGREVTMNSAGSPEDRYPGWARFATGAAAFMLGDIAGAAGAGLGAFNWKGLLLNIGAVIGVNALLYAVFGTLLTPLGATALMAVTGTANMEGMRRKFMKTVRTEMKKSLPEVARQQAQEVYDEIKKLFDGYGTEVMERISNDIESRQIELDELIKNKEKGEYQREAEMNRLKALEETVYAQWQIVETAYEQVLG